MVSNNNNNSTLEIKSGVATIMGDNFYNLFVKFMFIGLAVFSIFAFATISQENMNVNDKLINNDKFNNTFSDLSSNLNSFQAESQEQKNAFELDNPTAAFGGILLFSIVNSGKVFNAMTVTLFNTLIQLPTLIFGIDPMVISILLTLLFISIIIGLWILLK